MPFYKTNNLLPNQLSKSTQYRFTEIELQRLHYILTRTNQNPNETIIQMICPYLTNYHEPLKMLLHDYKFLNPTEAEMVHYFRYKNISMQKIRKYTNVQLNHLVQGGKYDTIPNFEPIFPYWKELESSIMTWDNIKSYFNLFKDDLIHTTKTKEKETKPKSTIKPQKEKTLEEMLEEDDDNPFVRANKFLNGGHF